MTSDQEVNVCICIQSETAVKDPPLFSDLELNALIFSNIFAELHEKIDINH